MFKKLLIYLNIIDKESCPKCKMNTYNPESGYCKSCGYSVEEDKL